MLKWFKNLFKNLFNKKEFDDVSCDLGYSGVMDFRSNPEPKEWGGTDRYPSEEPEGKIPFTTPFEAPKQQQKYEMKTYYYDESLAKPKKKSKKKKKKKKKSKKSK